MSSHDSCHWYVVRTKPRQEQRALENLEKQGFECYLPTVARSKKGRSRVIVTQEPLFKNYLFVRLNLVSSPSYLIRSTYGVSQLVRVGAHPVVAPESLIAQLRQRIQEPEPLFRTGEAVQIISGPFRDLEGVFQMSDGADRALILIEFLGKAQRIWLRDFDVKTI